LRGMRERHAGASTAARDALVDDEVVLGPAAEILRRDLLQLLDPVARHGVRRASHRMRRLAAARHAAPWQVSRRVAPREDDLLPRHAHHLGGDALTVGKRFGAEVADAGLDVHPAVRLDDEETVEADRARVVRTDRDAAAADLRALAHAAARFPFIPLEELRALV